MPSTTPKASFPRPEFPLPSLLLLITVFFMTFLGRTVLAPLLLTIQRDLNLSYAQGGSLFLTIAAGLTISMRLSGFVSRPLSHHRTIALAGLLTGAALFLLAVSRGLSSFRAGLLLAGSAAGLYLPSGLTALYSFVPSPLWGRAIALHELGPILGLTAGPFLAQAALHGAGPLPAAGWRPLLFLLSGICTVVSLLYLFRGRGGRSPGIPPRMTSLLPLLRLRGFWIVGFFFTLALGLEMGIYSMLPAFLVTAKGLSPALVNTLVGSSRLTPLLMIFAAGWLSDRLGFRRVMAAAAFSAGMATLLIGLTQGPVLTAALFLQPMLVSSFFPAGFSALAQQGPPQSRSLAVSLIIPLAYLLGGGLLPALIGLLADHGRAPLGIAAAGLLTAAAPLLLPLLPPSSFDTPPR